MLVDDTGILDVTPLSDPTRARFDRVQAVNPAAALRLAQAMRPALRALVRARIADVASIQGVRGAADCVSCAIAKGGMVDMTRAGAVELAVDGILVNCIAPGFVDTRMALLPDGTGHEHETAWFRDVHIRHGRIPLRRAAGLDDVAAAAFFCADDRRHVTGRILPVDGGVSATFGENEAMKITSVDCLGLRGRFPKGGWSHETEPGDAIHSLIVVSTDAGTVGIGSVFTDRRVVEAALGVLRPLCLSKRADEPMRVSEILHQITC